MRKKIMFIYRSQPSDFEQIKQISIKVASCGNYETSVISENYSEIIFKALKPDIVICLAECGDNNPSWDNIRKVYARIRTLIQPNQKLIRVGISSLQEGCKDIYYRLPIDEEQWKFILS